MNPIKNAIIYNVEFPDARTLAGHLEQLSFSPLNIADMSRSGFVANEITNELVTPIEGGYSFSLRHDEKVIPASAVNTKLKARIAEIEKAESRKVRKQEKTDLKEIIIRGMAVTAFAKSIIVNAFYQTESKLLIVATSSKKMADIMMGQLVKVFRSIKTTSIIINDLSNGLTAKLKQGVAITDDTTSHLGSFFIDNIAVLKKEGGQKTSFKLDDIYLASEGIYEAIKSGMTVEKIRLGLKTTAFNLSSDFRLSSINIPDAQTPTREELEHGADIWRHDAAVSMLIVCDIAKRLCEMFGYQAPVEEDA